MRTRHIHFILPFAIGMVLMACRPQNAPVEVQPAPKDTIAPRDTTETWHSTSQRQDMYRPQVHYSPLRNWMNDPNGLYYQDGLWHMCYQYNYEGEGCDFDHMCWGHASSPDLIHWTEHTPVMHWDENGAIYSGCSVVDERNVCGYGTQAVISFYTMHANTERIAMAVKRGDNPMYEKVGEVVHSDLPDFRDPHVAWDKAHNRWVMTIARGNEHGIEIWTSANLRNWMFCGIFRTDIERCNMGAWECPALIPFDDKWVLFISTNHNAAVFGSGTMYFVGNFDGHMFVPDNTEYPRFVDYGVDCYAGVPFSHTPADRKIIIAWMNNWDYATLLPYQGFRSAMTMPRELSLQTVDGTDYLCSRLPDEIESLADSTVSITDTWSGGSRCDAWLVESIVSPDKPAIWTLSNRFGQSYTIRLDAENHRIVCNRSGLSGESNFTPLFSVPSISAPIHTNSPTIRLQVLVDHSSVEVFSPDGAVSITNLVFPTEPYSHLTVSCEDHTTIVKPLHTIW